MKEESCESKKSEEIKILSQEKETQQQKDDFKL